MLCDESLAYWGRIFVAARLRERGITLGAFLEDPSGWLKALALPSAPVAPAGGYRPLLPRQRQVAQRLWRRWKQEAGNDGRREII